MHTFAGHSVKYERDFTLFQQVRCFFAAIIIFLLFLIATILLIPVILLSFGLLRNVIITHFGALLGRTMLWLFGIRVKYDYSRYKPDKPAVYISNHSSTLDFFAIISMKLPNIRYVAKKEIQYNPVFFVLGRITGQIFIDRLNTGQTIQKLKKTYAYIRRKNLSLLVAPEGTRKHKGMVGPFKKGAFHMARDLGYSVVPVYIDGAFPLCPGSRLLTAPGEITLRYFPPVDVSKWDEKVINDEIERLRNLYKDCYRETFARMNTGIEDIETIDTR